MEIKGTLYIFATFLFSYLYLHIRFAAGNLTEYILHLAHEIDPKRRNELGLGQHPYAVVLTCSDSRVSPELIFVCH